MLREDKKAGFYSRHHFLFWRKYYFTAPGLKLPVRLSGSGYKHLGGAQLRTPVWVTRADGRMWWWFEGAFYWEDEGYAPDDVLALVRDRQRKKARQLQRAKDMLALDATTRAVRREPIPAEIRRAVFTRDGGRCVECGSNFDLQYDHILPVTLGGATTVGNLQILCADCNRRKSDSL
jgi:hypothetical protein